MKTAQPISKRVNGIAYAMLVAGLVRIALSEARAATYYWDNNGTTNGFGRAAGTWAAPTVGSATQGWSTSSAGTLLPGSVTTTASDDLNFGSGTNGLASGTVTVNGAVQANSLTIASSSGDITLSGGSLAFGGSGAFIQANNSGQTISSAITLNTNLSVIAGINGNPVLTLDGPLTGHGNLTFTTPSTINGTSGANTVVGLGAANSYTGATLITAENINNSLTVKADVANALPRATVLTLDGGDGAGSGRTVAYELNGKSQTLAGLSSVDGLTLRTQRILNSTGTATLTISNTINTTFYGNINGSGLSLTKTGTGTQTLVNGSSYTGATTINAGKLQGVTGGHCANSSVVLNGASGTFGVAIGDTSLTWTCAALTVTAAGTLEFDFDVTPGKEQSPLSVTGQANFPVSPAIQVLVPSALTVGSYPLITWGSIAGTPPTAVSLSSLLIGTGAGLNVSNSTLFLVITNLAKVNMTVRVETKADGSGVVAPAATLADGAARTNFAIARNNSGAFLGNVAANWFLTNVTGRVVSLDLVAAPDGKSAIFTAGAAGSARIAAFANATNHVLSGVITVTNTYSRRPFIWVRSWERNGILLKIGTNAWATSQFNALVARAAGDLASYQADRDAWLRGLPVNWTASPPTFNTGASSYNTGESYFNTALDCAVLYYLTGDTGYARCAADILHNSVQAFQNLAPSTSVANGGWLIPSDLLYEARQVGTQLPVVYDFLYPYLQTNKVYDVETAAMKSFSFTDAQYVFRTYYELVRDHGQKDSNWSALMSTCMLNNLLALDSASERAAALQVYLVTGSSRQASLDYDYNNYTNPGDIWPESLQYSGEVGSIRSTHLVLLERYDPQLDLFGSYPNLPLSLPRISYLQYPNASMQISFGDGHRDAEGQPFFRYELMYQQALARGRSDLTALFGPLINAGVSSGSYARSTLSDYSRLGQHDEPLGLLWNAPAVTEAAKARTLPRTDTLPFAGITLQRNPSTVNNSTYGLMCFVGGASHVHSHASGMSMELFGLGQVMGAKAGRSDYGTTLHENYYRLFSANNTVVVNAASQGSGGWEELGINTVQSVAMEPQPFAEAVSSNFSFTCSSFADTMGSLAEATQQRTLAIIRTSPTNGFYVDFFRSKSTVTSRVATTLSGNVTNQFHDYIYHNIGTTNVEVWTNSVDLPLFSQPKRFQNDIGDVYEQPGWRYFTNTVVSYPHRAATRAQFRAAPSGTSLYMDMFLPAVTNREYALVTSPPIVDYSSSDSPALAVRQIGEAWNKAFAVVYEPHYAATGATVTNVTALWKSTSVAGVKIESVVNGLRRVHYVFSNTNATDTYTDSSIGLSFTGRFGVVADNGDGTTALYLGQGKALSYRGNAVSVVGNTNAPAEVRFTPGQPPVVSSRAPLNVTQYAPPVVDAGPAQTVYLREGELWTLATLAGSASDPAGDPLTAAWTLVDGPAAVVFADASATNTTATFTTNGVYTLRLTASDDFGEAYDDVEVTVNLNVSPSVNAGTNQTLFLSTYLLWTPASLSTVAWYDAADTNTITHASGAVSQWNDKSTRGYNLVQTTAASKPLTGSRTMNGLNTIDFNGVTNFMSMAAGFQPGSSNSMIFAVIHKDVANKDQRLFNCQSSTSTRFGLLFNTPSNTGTNLDFIHAGSYTPTSVAAGTGQQLVSGYKNGTATGVGINGSYTTASTGATAPTLTKWYLGCYNGTSAFFDGSVGEIVVLLSYNLEDRQKIEGYLAHKWGLAGSLPENHPYKSAAPGAPTAVAALRGTVTDPDGGTLTTAWTKVSGPAATVAFGNASATNTTATFTAEGIYTLRLTANDTFSSRSDDCVITVRRHKGTVLMLFIE